MDTCEFQSSCAFYNELKEEKPTILKYLLDEYCDSGYSECARFMVSKVLGPRHVSRELFPEDMQEACKILDELH